MRSNKVNFIAVTLGMLSLVVVTASCGGVPYDEFVEGSGAFGEDSGDVQSETKKVLHTGALVFTVKCPSTMLFQVSSISQDYVDSGWWVFPRTGDFGASYILISNGKTQISCSYSVGSSGRTEQIAKWVDGICTKISEGEFRCMPN